jgi:hypothetical protein
MSYPSNKLDLIAALVMAPNSFHWRLIGDYSSPAQGQLVE